MHKYTNTIITIIFSIILANIYVVKSASATNIVLDGYILQMDKSPGFNDILIGANWDVIEENCEIIEPIEDIDNFSDWFPCYGGDDYWYNITIFDGVISAVGLELGQLDNKKLQTLKDSIVNVHGDDNIYTLDEYSFILKNGNIVLNGYEDGSYILYYLDDAFAKQTMEMIQ